MFIACLVCFKKKKGMSVLRRFCLFKIIFIFIPLKKSFHKKRVQIGRIPELMLSYPINNFVILKIIFYNFVITLNQFIILFHRYSKYNNFITYICYKMFYYFILYILKIKMNCNYFGISVSRLCVCSQQSSI